MDLDSLYTFRIIPGKLVEKASVVLYIKMEVLCIMTVSEIDGCVLSSMEAGKEGAWSKY